MGGLFRQYAWIVDLVGVLFCSFLLAKITGVYVGRALEVKRSIGVLAPAEAQPSEKKQVDIAEYKIIVDRNLFDATDHGGGAGGAGSSGPGNAEPTPTGEAVKTSLSINVIGVLVVGDGRDERSTATIAGGKEKGGTVVGGVYAVNDEKNTFAPGTKLTRIQPDRIEFINNGRLEYAEVATDVGTDIFGPPTQEAVAQKGTEAKPEAKDALVQKDAPGKYTIDKREIDDAMQNLDRLYTEIRAVPNFSGGKVSGMKVLSVKGDSLFAKLGLRRGDVLMKINGLELDVKSGFAIFGQLKDQKNLALELVRQGQPTTLEYEIR